MLCHYTTRLYLNAQRLRWHGQNDGGGEGGGGAKPAMLQYSSSFELAVEGAFGFINCAGSAESFFNFRKDSQRQKIWVDEIGETSEAQQALFRVFLKTVCFSAFKFE